MGREYTDKEKEMGRRFGIARKSLRMKQTEFAERMGLSRSFVSQVESGCGLYGERTIAEICKIFGVNRSWLETGEGKMFAPQKKEEAISSLFADVLRGEDNFKQKVVSGLARLSEEDWIVLEKLCDKVIGEDTEG